MRKLIIITGDLAAGKSTLANSLSAELQIPCLIKDTLKEIACDAIGYETREENRELSISAVNSMIYVFNQTAKVGGDLILEANFRSEEIEDIKGLQDRRDSSGCKTSRRRCCEKTYYGHGNYQGRGDPCAQGGAAGGSD